MLSQLPNLIHDLMGFHLTLTSGSTLILTLTEQKVYHARQLDKITMVELRWCINFDSATTFGRVMNKKPKPDLQFISVQCILNNQHTSVFHALRRKQRIKWG